MFVTKSQYLNRILAFYHILLDKFVQSSFLNCIKKYTNIEYKCIFLYTITKNFDIILTGNDNFNTVRKILKNKEENNGNKLV